MSQLWDVECETLWEDDEFVLSRGTRESDSSPMLVLAPLSAQPTASTVARLEHAFALRDKLSAQWATRPVALVEHRGRPTLLLEDPGGEVLARVLERPLDLKTSLRIAIGLSVAIGQVHKHGFIHKDIKPSNILVDTTTGDARLTGFGFASPLPRERRFPDTPERIAGTLAYMAPEQTGRMNRTMDARSDLYSLGVTLYEMLAGALPFEASDPAEWIHCHIARQPTPLAQRAKGLPGALSAVVMKLLAKVAEERYQTASGLEGDLRRCLAAWESQNRIDRFPLGTLDVPDDLLISERLYGRELEIESLREAFEGVAADGTSRMVFVSGNAGIGKSSLVNEMHRTLVPSQVLFASGKFDQYKRDIPYATVAQAFQQLIRRALQSDDRQLEVWRTSMMEAVGSNGQLMVNLMPELEVLIGKQPRVSELASRDAQNRFQLVFRRFLAVFARREHPLVLFLDDLQWIDAATLELLEHLVAASEVKYLLLVGAYRDNEVGAEHPLRRTIDAVRQAQGMVREIRLKPLGMVDLGRFVEDTLHGAHELSLPLTQLIYEKTDGNPFFAIQFISALAGEGLLTFDHGTAGWRWDIERIRSKGFTDNVVELMVGRLTRLPKDTQGALRRLACLGNVASTSLLSVVHEASEEQLHAALSAAVALGLVMRLEDRYAFLHDRVHEAAYGLILASERAEEHLRIGRVLAAHVGQLNIAEHVFEIVNQLNRGAALIESPVERRQVAELNLIAGQRAQTSTAYAAARAYLSTGRDLLGEDPWAGEYSLAFALEFHLAECEFLTTALEAAERRLSLLRGRAQGVVDRASVAWLQTTLYTALDRSDRAIEVGLEYLRDVGVDWSPRPTKEQARAEYSGFRQLLGDRPVHELIDLPLLTDPDLRATLDVLTAMLPPAFFSDENLVCLLLSRMATISVEHGNTDASALAYAYLGMVVGPHFQDYPSAFSFGKLGFDLVERGPNRYRARVYHTVGAHVIPWTRPIRTAPPLLRRAFDATKEVGDLTYSGFSSCTLITSRLGVGDRLDEVQREAEERLEFVRATKFGLIIDIITSQLMLVRVLRGLPRFDERALDEAAFEAHLEGNPSLAIACCWYWIRKMQTCLFTGNMPAALAALLKAEPLIWTSPGHFEFAEYHFYAALVRAAAYEGAMSSAQDAHLSALRAHQQQLELWAGNCPENFGSRTALVAAEIARIEKRDVEAMRLYEAAIGSAHAESFVQNEALANELAARFYAGRDYGTISDTYFANARSCYLRWGAEGKVRDLDAMKPRIVDEPTRTLMVVTSAEQSEQLDLAAFIKTSQAISSAVGLSGLFDTLMKTVLEHSGAERGLLLLARAKGLRIEAEATTVPGTIDVSLRRREVLSWELPESVLQVVVRTKEFVLLDDVQASNQFSTDPYLVARKPRSMLCLPLMKQAEILGVLYLENTLAPHVFTAARIAMLKLLASQAAISLQNASLGEKEALLKEVHHRVKNNLQLISSLLNLQAARIADPAVAELFMESRNRVRSMALVHENLYRAGDFSQIPMEQHIQSLCAQLTRAYSAQSQSVELSISVSDSQLEMDRALACGLIINELVSNALKHAFPGGRAGHIWVELQPHGERQNVLVVRDDGVGISPGSEFGRADTLGLQLVHDLSRQLGATVAMSTHGGTTFTIGFDTHGDAEGFQSRGHPAVD